VLDRYAVSVNIRNATTADASTIANGEHATATTPGLLNALPGEIPESDFVNKIAELSDKREGLYIVADDAEKISGHLLLDPMPLASNSHICSLTIVVYPGNQNQGVGRLLMQHALDWAIASSEIEKIELTVRASNKRALGLYRSMGFVEEGRIRNRVKVDGKYHDDIAMSLFV